VYKGVIISIFCIIRILQASQCRLNVYSGSQNSITLFLNMFLSHRNCRYTNFTYNLVYELWIFGVIYTDLYTAYVL